MDPDTHAGTAASQRVGKASIESVSVGQTNVPFRICWGDHADLCDIGPRGSEAGHDPVAQIDYDNPDHRRVLRWLRRLDPGHSRPYAIPHPATLVGLPVRVPTEITDSPNGEEQS